MRKDEPWPHERDQSGVITSRVVGEGAIKLDPPGIVLERIFI